MGMALINTEIHCRGNEDDIKEMWLSITREAANGRRVVDFANLVPAPEGKADDPAWQMDNWGSASGAIHEVFVNINKNFACFDTREAAPMRVYVALIRRFPAIRFFISYVSYEDYDRAAYVKGCGGYVVGENSREFSRGGEEDIFAWAAGQRAAWALEMRSFARNISNKALRRPTENRSRGLLFTAKVFRNGYILKFITDKTELLCSTAVAGNPFAVKFIDPPQDRYDRAAVEANPLALAVIREQTRELCLAAIARDAASLSLVREQSPEVCGAALRSAMENGDNRTVEIFRLIHDKTEKLCLQAARQDGNALKYVEAQTPEICLAAVKQNGTALVYVRQQNQEICFAAVRQNGLALKFADRSIFSEAQYSQLCLAAVNQDGYALQYIENSRKTKKLCLAALRSRGLALEYVEDRSPKLCMRAVRVSGRALEFVPDKTPELCLAAVRKDGRALAFVPEKTPELCLAAVK